MNRIKNYYFVGSILGSIGTTFFMPILYIYLSKKGYSLTELGFYLSMFWLITFLLEIPTGILADSLGQRRSLMISGFIRGVGLLLLLMNKNYSILLFSGILTGTAEALSSGSLSSWVVNKLKKEGYSENLQKLFATSGNISAPIGLILGYLTSKYIYIFNMDLPILLSGAVFILMGLYYMFIFPCDEKNIKNYNYKLLLREISTTTKATLRFFKNNKEISLMFIVLIIPSTLDVGPSNQWQLAFSEKGLSISNIWIMLSLIGIFANTLLTKLPQTKNFKKEYFLLLILDVVFIFAMIYSKYTLIFFMLHAFIIIILEMKVGVYLHEELIKEDSLRSTMVSSFNTLESLFITMLLPISGKLSDKYSILESWKIMILSSIIVISVIYLVYDRWIKRRQYLKEYANKV